MTSKLNPVRIVEDHVATFVHHGTKKRHWPDFIAFFGLPLVIATLVVTFEWFLLEQFLGVVGTVLSVFAALLFNLLLIIYDIGIQSRRGADAEGSKDRDLDVLMDHTSRNITFSILTAVTALVVLLASFLDVPSFPADRHLWNGVMAFLSVLFIMTLYMVLKRIHVLLAEELSEGGA